MYENRFVYHLIQRLFAFVDKRTDVIFWSTGDETCNTMCMESKIDDANEEISYKVEMTVKNRQSFAEMTMTTWIFLRESTVCAVCQEHFAPALFAIL